MKIRPFDAGEAQAILDLWRFGDATPSVTDTIADLERVAGKEHARCLVAESDGRIAALHRETRRAPLRSFAHRLIFRVHPEAIVVIGLFHASATPGSGVTARRRTTTRSWRRKATWALVAPER